MQSLPEAGATGDREALLRALLAELTADYAGTEDVRTKAALANQIRGTSADLAKITDNGAKAGDPVDEIAKRRAARGAGAATSPVRAKRSR